MAPNCPPKYTRSLRLLVLDGYILTDSLRAIADPIRTGCMGNVERYRVIPTPANPHGLDPATETSIATALRRANYATGTCCWTLFHSECSVYP